METMWIVVADSATARIFSSEGAGKPWLEFKQLYHTESLMHARELASDLPGRIYAYSGLGNNRMEPRQSRNSTDTRVFARQVAQFLGQHEPEYEQLMLICAPKFLDLIRNQLDSSVEGKITDELALNLVRQDVGTIRTLAANNVLPHVGLSRAGVNPGRII